MITLSATLEAAQQAPSGRPDVRLRLFDFDLGVTRLRFTRWHDAAAVDGPTRCAVLDDGTLIRTRIWPATGNLYVSRVTSPGPGSTYTSWTLLDTVHTDALLALSAQGDRVLIATLRADGAALLVYESDDGGQTFGTTTTITGSIASTTAIAIALHQNETDGSATILYAQGGAVLHRERSGVGLFSAASTWTRTLATINGLAALSHTDIEVLVSGTDPDGNAGCWAVALGLGVDVSAGTWTALEDIALASPGTDVTYTANSWAFAFTARVSLTEHYAGAGAYDRVQLSNGASAGAFTAGEFRDPRPFDFESPYGLGIGAGGDDVYLVSPGGVWHAESNAAAEDLSADLVTLDLHQEEDAGGVLRASLAPTAALPTALGPGAELAFDPGFVTTAGQEWATGRRYWVHAVRRSRTRDGRALIEVDAVDALRRLFAWRAPRQLEYPGGSLTSSAAAILADLVTRAGLNLTSSDASALAGSYQPAYTVRAGETGRSAVLRLLERIPDQLHSRGSLLRLEEPDAAAVATYAYGAGHPIAEASVEARAPGTGWARIFGEGVFAEAFDADALAEGAPTLIAIDANLDAAGEAQSRADTGMRRGILEPPAAQVLVPVNCGQEVGDVVAVTDATLGLAAAEYRVRAMRLRFHRGPGAPRYEMALQLGEV